MLALGPTSYYSERMPSTPFSIASHSPNACPVISEETGSYPDTLRPPRHSLQISKFCPFPRRKEKEDERRRQTFLKKVRDAGEERKWEQRGENILSKDYVSGQKRWEALQVEAAPETAMVPEDEETELKAEVSRTEGTETIDEMLQHEREEFEALMCLLEDGSSSSELETSRTDYGSDDEDFNSDCLEALRVSETSRSTSLRPPENLLGSCLPMDMSID